jgi:hypothetical protein
MGERTAGLSKKEGEDLIFCLKPADQENHLEEDRALCYLEEENQGKKKSLLKEDRLLH